jgi:hypothetical protein
MPAYCIVETEDGWTIAERRDGETAIETAEREGAVLIDAGPYQNYEEAQEALTALEGELDDDETSDLPGNQPLEDRYEVD